MKTPMHPLAKLDHQYIWHPFTQMRDWLRTEPIVITSGKGAVLVDANGHEYLDANASIWTNLHGHGHPRINAAITRQLAKIAHSSALGLANEPASLLAERLVAIANPPLNQPGGSSRPAGRERKSPGGGLKLPKLFYSDDGSTAIEVALKLAYEHARRSGQSRRPKFLSLAGAYHGDTVGSVSLGHIDLFHQAYTGLLFKSDRVMAPYCYRCPHNRAAPERKDARDYRRCKWECIGKLDRLFAAQKKRGNPYAALVVEPLVQGAAGMIPQPRGWLAQAAEITRRHGALLVADEVMTGFCRTNEPHLQAGRELFFACHEEGVQPDLMAVAKGFTGGYLPLAATLASQAVYDSFLGEYEEFKTFFHGHSFTANQLGSAAALANLDLLDHQASATARAGLIQHLRRHLESLWELPWIGDLRQIGTIAGIELVRDWRQRQPFPLAQRVGSRICAEMAANGVLTRPIGNILVLMPPYCTTGEQVARMVSVMRDAIQQILGNPRIKVPGKGA